MKERFEGKRGRPNLIDELCTHSLVGGNRTLAEAIADVAILHEIKPGNAIITQGSSESDVFLILSGSFMIVINGRNWRPRGPRDHVGEMAAIEPSQPRSATVIAQELSVVAQLTQEQFFDLANHHREMWRVIAKELSRRLNQRNAQITLAHDRPEVFIASSSESLPIAKALKKSFESDPITVTIWTDDVFTPSGYTLECLEDALDKSDFAIVVAAEDDIITSRKKQHLVPRDNVTFELGLSIGRIGRKRTFLLEPRKRRIKLASDLHGLTTIPYEWDMNIDPTTQLTTASNSIRKVFKDLGSK